jgi:hypothetical protein
MTNLETLSLVGSDKFNNLKNNIDLLRQLDKGYNKIKLNGKYVQFYTTGGQGNYIRNAETGEYYYNYLVGSNNENLFFSVVLATGQCKSKNGSTTLFYVSPQQYMSHCNTVVNYDIIARWQEKQSQYILNK